MQVHSFCRRRTPTLRAYLTEVYLPICKILLCLAKIHITFLSASPQTDEGKRPPLRSLMRLSEMPMTKKRREARECARVPCTSTVRLETSDIPSDDCLAAFCLVNQDRLAPPRKNTDSIPKTAAIFRGSFNVVRSATK